MCGIVGYYGKSEDVLDTLISGLKRLEYRGYDSCGIAIVTEDEVYNQKSTGRVKSLEENIKNQMPASIDHVGIAHTRWATHGLPNETNAHPHHSEDKKIWLNHNGVIENYKSIKSKLEDKGYKFYSETDTEVIAQLIADYYEGDLRAATLKALKELDGAFALTIISADEPNRIIGAKMGSPMILGIKEGQSKEYILASDVAAVISKTRNVVFIEDGELVDIQNGDYEIINFDNSVLNKEVTMVEWSDEQATKQGHDHFLIKEIMEQPQAVLDSTRGRLLPDSGDVKFGGLMDVLDRIDDIERVVLLGIGTAYYACKMGELYFEDVAGIPAKAEMSSEFRLNNPYIDDKTWIIAVSQSGETKHTLDALDEARKKGALVTGIVNVVGSTIARFTDAGVYNHAGPEISVASTKAFTTQVSILLMHAVMVGRRKSLALGKGQSIVNGLKDLPELMKQTLELNDTIKVLAEKYADSQDMIYMGTKYNYPMALEGALKNKEITYMHAEGLSSSELKHGFLALVDDKMPVISLCTHGMAYDKEVVSVEQVKSRGGKTIAVTNEGLDVATIVDDAIIVPKSEREEIQPILNNMAMQMFAYHTSVARGLDVDKPRNLAKSVTVE